MINFIKRKINRKLIRYTEEMRKENKTYIERWEKYYKETGDIQYREKYLRCLGVDEAISRYEVLLKQHRCRYCKTYGIYKK